MLDAFLGFGLLHDPPQVVRIAYSNRVVALAAALAEMKARVELCFQPRLLGFFFVSPRAATQSTITPKGFARDQWRAKDICCGAGGSFQGVAAAGAAQLAGQAEVGLGVLLQLTVSRKRPRTQRWIARKESLRCRQASLLTKGRSDALSRHCLRHALRQSSLAASPAAALPKLCFAAPPSGGAGGCHCRLQSDRQSRTRHPRLQHLP